MTRIGLMNQTFRQFSDIFDRFKLRLSSTGMRDHLPSRILPVAVHFHNPVSVYKSSLRDPRTADRAMNGLFRRNNFFFVTFWFIQTCPEGSRRF